MKQYFKRFHHKPHISHFDLEHLITCLSYDIPLSDTLNMLGLRGHNTKLALDNILMNNSGGLNDIDLLKRALAIKQYNHTLIMGLFTHNAYSWLLIILSYGMMLFILLFFCDFVTEMLQGLGVKSHIGVLKAIVSLYFIIKTILLLALIIFILLMRDSKKRILCFGFLSHTKLTQLYKLYISALFSYTLSSVWQSQRNIKAVIQIIRSKNFGLECQWVGFQIDTRLEQGISFEDSLNVPMLDSYLITSIKTGLASNLLDENLKRYHKLALLQLKRKLGHIKRLISGIAFVDVCIVILVYYHLLYQTLRIVEGIQG